VALFLPPRCQRQHREKDHANPRQDAEVVRRRPGHICGGLASLTDLASPVASPQRLAAVSAKVAGAVLEAGGKAEKLLSGKGKTGQPGYSRTFRASSLYRSDLAAIYPCVHSASPVSAEAGCSIVRGFSRPALQGNLITNWQDGDILIGACVKVGADLLKNRRSYSFG
jgi:hypothetical protein